MQKKKIFPALFSALCQVTGKVIHFILGLRDGIVAFSVHHFFCKNLPLQVLFLVSRPWLGKYLSLLTIRGIHVCRADKIQGLFGLSELVRQKSNSHFPEGQCFFFLILKKIYQPCQITFENGIQASKTVSTFERSFTKRKITCLTVCL